MDPQQLKAAFAELEALDQRLSYKLKRGRRISMVQPGVDQLTEQVAELQEYTLALKEIVRQLIMAIAARPPAAAPPQPPS